MSLGSSLYNARKKSGLSQEHVAEKLGVSRQTISKWEVGSMQPTLENLKSLCAYFNVDANYFVGTETATVKAEAIETKVETTEQTSIAANGSKNEKRKKVLKLILTIAITAVLFFTVIICAIISYITIAPDSGQQVVYAHSFDSTGIISSIIGIIALIAIFVILIFLLKNRRKK